MLVVSPTIRVGMSRWPVIGVVVDDETAKEASAQDCGQGTPVARSEVFLGWQHFVPEQGRQERACRGG